MATWWLIAEGSTDQGGKIQVLLLTTKGAKAACSTLQSLASARLLLILKFFLNAVHGHYQTDPGPSGWETEKKFSLKVHLQSYPFKVS